MRDSYHRRITYDEHQMYCLILNADFLSDRKKSDFRRQIYAI